MKRGAGVLCLFVLLMTEHAAVRTRDEDEDARRRARM